MFESSICAFLFDFHRLITFPAELARRLHLLQFFPLNIYLWLEFYARIDLSLQAHQTNLVCWWRKKSAFTFNSSLSRMATVFVNGKLVLFFPHSHNLDECIVFTSGIYSGVYCLLSAFYSIPKYFQSNLIKRTEPNHFRSDCIDSMNKSIYKSECWLFFFSALFITHWLNRYGWLISIYRMVIKSKWQWTFRNRNESIQAHLLNKLVSVYSPKNGIRLKINNMELLVVWFQRADGNRGRFWLQLLWYFIHFSSIFLHAKCTCSQNSTETFPNEHTSRKCLFNRNV